MPVGRASQRSKCAHAPPSWDSLKNRRIFNFRYSGRKKRSKGCPIQIERQPDWKQHGIRTSQRELIRILRQTAGMTRAEAISHARVERRKLGRNLHRAPDAKTARIHHENWKTDALYHSRACALSLGETVWNVDEAGPEFIYVPRSCRTRSFTQGGTSLWKAVVVRSGRTHCRQPGYPSPESGRYPRNPIPFTRPPKI